MYIYIYIYVCIYIGGHLLAVKLAQNLVHQYSDPAAAGHSHADLAAIIQVYISCIQALLRLC
jgi:hypothetical protein